jgi:hypothetical protein
VARNFRYHKTCTASPHPPFGEGSTLVHLSAEFTFGSQPEDVVKDTDEQFLALFLALSVSPSRT